MAQPYFTHEVHFTNPARDLFRCAKEKSTPSACFSLCKDYKKDIFGRFAYDFELSQNILSFLI